jgi:hypothetical protein
VAAKEVLATAGVERIGPEKGRSKSDNRSALAADAADLMEMLKKYDEDSENNSVFAPLDLEKLGVVPPEEIANSASQVIRIKNLEQKLEYVMKTLTEHESSIGLLFDIQTTKSENTFATRTAALRDTQGTHSLNLPALPRKSSAPKQGPAVSVPGASSLGEGTSTGTQNTIRPPNQIKANYTDADGFIFQRDQIKRYERTQSKGRNVVIGTRTDDRLKGSPAKLDIVVSRVSKEYDEEEMFRFLTEEEIDIWTDDIRIISHEEHITHTFKISLKKNDRNKVLNGKFWSEGIETRPFVFRRRVSTDEKA